MLRARHRAHFGFFVWFTKCMVCSEMLAFVYEGCLKLVACIHLKLTCGGKFGVVNAWPGLWFTAAEAT